MTTLADLERVERELRARAKKLHAHGYYSESAKEEQMADTIAAYIRIYAPNEVPDARPYQGPATTDAAQERIARALERIADALEKKP